jgi:uncharacterized protein YjbI with pentapeptide repeats
MDPIRSAEVWSRLMSGRAVDDLGLPVVNGRTDLSGIAAPEPSVVREYVTLGANVKELGDLVVFRGRRWKKLDFSRGQLKSLRFFDCEIEDCCFDGADCSSWRMWGTSISNTSFKAADLRQAALGGVDNGKRNSFRRVDFTKADLRRTVYVSAEMLGCAFAQTKLAKVDFQGTVFVDCVFEGKLEEVQFHRHAFRGEAFPPNEMKGVDLRKAKLKYVEFQGLDMRFVKLPEGG